MTVLRQVNIGIIIYPDDMLVMGATLSEIIMTRDTSITTFEFSDRSQKLVLRPLKQIEFLGVVIDTEKMTLALPKKKLQHVSQQCKEIFTQPKTSVLNLTKLIGLLSSTIQAILPVRIQFSYLQQ